ncbi:hypothetical protein RP20_CCG015953 [Aedes albopictus]|nr:hypothetical protein RP20_CCG015953 [Aedes albopictus]
MKYEIGGYRNSVDLDAEQTEARYDQGMLSDIMNDERPPSELQKAESCVADNFKYDHGQKIQRYDPCEICLCIDGEIFCWWKQCDVPAQPMLDDDGDDDRPLGAIGDVQLAATSSSQLTTYNASSSTTTTPSVDPSKPSAGELTNVATAFPQPVTSAAAAAALPYPDQPDSSQQQQQQQNVRTVQHPPQSPSENIPQNILSFPQSPPIMMMYRPGLLGGKNASSSGASTTSERNKHGGPLKKVKPLHLAANGAGGGGKKSYRKSKGGKGYVINYGRIEGGLEDGGGRTRVLAVTERIPQLSADGMRVLNDGERGFVPAVDEGFGGYGFGMIKEPEDDKQQHYIITSSGHVEMFDDNSMEATENAFGMNRLPSQQSQQGSTSTTTIPPMALVLGGTLDDSPNQSATSSSVHRQDNGGSDSNQGGPIAPLIVMTTNVTQHSNYSVRFSPDAAGGSPPLTQYAPQLLSPSAVQQSAGSVIDVLNSTTKTTTTTMVDGTDYLDDNQTELIYPAIPGLSSSSSSSSSSGSSGGSSSYASRRTGGGDGQQVQMTTTSMTTNSATAETRKTPEQHCVVMGVPYKVGAVLKQETGNCLHCVCVQGPDSDPVPRVTCTPLNCPPLILPDVLDGAGF